MVRSIARMQHPSHRLDPARIAGISLAIVVNLGLFGVLMAPIDIVGPARPGPERSPVNIIRPDRPLPPLPVPVEEHHQKQPRPQTLTRATVKPVPQPVTPSSISRPIDPPVISTPPASTIDDQRVEPVRPVQTSLVPILSPAPPYPRGPLTDGIEGTVVLELLVGTDGHVLQARVVRGSGDRRLDAAARDTILRGWRFAPAMRDGRPIQALGLVPVVFRLDDAR